MQNKQVEQLIESYADAYAKKLAQWIRIPSVKTEPEPNAPFGAQVRRMYDLAIADCQEMGFDVRTFDGYALDATLGNATNDPMAVLGHLDVVPAGDGWRMDPFAAIQEGNLLYGRGTSDDKGPVLCSLFAMKAIKEAGIALKRPIRLILGCDEESGWEDMAYYVQHTQMPEMGFSPDAAFPLINTEKGMLHIMLRGKLADTGLKVLKLHTGERLNVIAGESTAVVAGDASTVQKVTDFAQKTGLDYTARLTDEGVEITATGIPGHSAYPEGRRSAIGMMLILLRELGVEGALKTLADVYGMEFDGRSLGIACEDEVSGPLTCNMGILHVDGPIVTATLDCRCPLCADLPLLKQTAIDRLIGFTVEAETKQPHHVPADGELVSSLLAAYHEETGLPAIPESTGGGTYAKVLKQGVAFGAAFPGDEDLAHQANEYVDLHKMITATKIYANALLRLCAE